MRSLGPYLSGGLASHDARATVGSGRETRSCPHAPDALWARQILSTNRASQVAHVWPLGPS